MTIDELKKYPIAFDGKTFIGPNVCDVVYCWTENDVPCYVGITANGMHDRCHKHLKTQTESLFQSRLRARPEAFKCYIIDQFYLHADPKHSYQHILDLETYYIEQFNTYHRSNPNAYNLTTGGQGHTGYVASDETRKKMSDSKIGKKRGPVSEETRKKMSIAAKMRPPVSDEIRKKISDAGKGKIATEETKRKMSISRKGKSPYNRTIETRKNASMASKIAWQSKTRKPVSEETLKKRSISMKMVWQNKKKQSLTQQDYIDRFFYYKSA